MTCTNLVGIVNLFLSEMNPILPATEARCEPGNATGWMSRTEASTLRDNIILNFIYLFYFIGE